MEKPEVSIVIVNYNGGGFLEECLEALIDRTKVTIEIIVVDNASTDHSADHLEERYPSVKLLRNNTNIGYSRAINRGAESARGKFLAILNMDIVVQNGWLAPLVLFLDNHPTAAIAAPCILLYDRPDQINAAGQNLHVTGLGFNRKLNTPADAIESEPVRVSGTQGGAFLMPARLFHELGGMNEDYFLYHEDVELSLRVNIAGYDIFVIPEAIVYHKYDLHMTPAKLHWLERHRWLTLLSIYRPRTLVALSPILLVTEFLMIGYCLTRGLSFIKAKYRAVIWVFQHPEIVRRSQFRVQSLRKISDRSLISKLRWAYDWDQFIILAKQKGNWIREIMSGLLPRRSHDRIA